MSEGSFLYPFLGAQERDAGPLLADLARSARSKAEQSRTLQQQVLRDLAGKIGAAGSEMAARFVAGGRLFTFGNGGSSTDADTLAGLFRRPARGTAVPAWSLTADHAILTALGNDVGFDLIFSRQLGARAKAGDVAIALSTSGNSADLMKGLGEARARGLYTVGFSGYDGGDMAASDAVDVCFTVPSQSIHRIQESQAVIGYRLWEAVQESMSGGSQS